jgi:putative membrane protein insertion efficiency factor
MINEYQIAPAEGAAGADAPARAYWPTGPGHSLVMGASSLATGAFILAIRAYQLTLSPAQTFLFGAAGGCRFTPSCSAYALQALRERGLVTGAMLSAGRICRCHPWGGCGHDPVPPRDGRPSKSKIGNSELAL